MGRITAYVVALALGAAAALGLVSCGGGDSSQLLPGDTAKEITANLDQVEQLATSGNCTGAQQAAQEVSNQVDALGGVSKQLKQALRDGAERLNRVVAGCETTAAEATVAPTLPSETDTSTEPAKKKKPPKKTETTPNTTSTDTTTTTSTPTTPTTPTSPTTTPTPTPPTGGGGTGAPSGGVSPGSPATGSP